MAAEGSPPPTLAEACRNLEAALEAFRRLAARAIEAAADPRAGIQRVDEARHQATFALAAVGATLKTALKAARPSSNP
ncbi:MAG TPA: hypothetical protein VND21_11710 [Planctomycetota bacterium]|nr:hypothetical protein [Planctomycetota bacterium]